jgi:hypothetical protein
MARKRSAVNENIIGLLKQFVRNKTHLPCSSFADMQQLQLQVKNAINEYLSIQTLNRFFGLIHNRFKPAASTLDILSRFVNYRSFAEFELFNRELLNSHNECSDHAGLIISLLSNVEPSTIDEGGLLCVLKNLVDLMEKDSCLAKDVYPFLASTEFGQKYFFEHLVNIDALNGHYGEGLAYYLLNTQNREQQFFAYCMLCFRYFLSDNQLLFYNYFNKIIDYKRSEIKTFHPNLIARYYATIVFSNFLNNELVNISDEATTVIQGLRKNHEIGVSFPMVEYIFGRALILVGEYHSASEILRQASADVEHTISSTYPGFVNQYNLLQLYADFNDGQINEQKAIKHLQSIEAKPFYFLSQNFFTLLLLDLRKSLSSNALIETINRQTEILVKKTGFHFFETKENSGTMEKSA